jgi:hypothetical protein
MAEADRLAAALRYQQGMALPTPEPDSMVGRALDVAAQWGRGVQKNVSDLVSPTAWAEALKNPPRGVLSQMNPENKQEMIGQGIDAALNFGPGVLGTMRAVSSKLMAAPQAEALRLAQQRAALPVDQGGLGLPAGNTPQQRAAAMGAEFGWGHGSNNPDITTFKPSRTGAQGPGIYATNYLPETNMYSSLKDTGGTSYPLAVFKDEALVSKLNNAYDELKVSADDELISELFKKNKSAIITNQEPTPDWLLKQGVFEYPERQHYVSVNPDNFRSRFAAFDPFRRNAAVAAAMGVAAPDLLAQENK